MSSLDLLNPKVLEQAIQQYLSYKKDPEALKGIRRIGDNFHDSETWERVSDVALMSILNVLGIPEQISKHEENFDLHTIIMSLFAVGFVSGFDAGYKFQVEHTTEQQGGLA